MNITRRNFIGSLTAALALPAGFAVSATKKEGDWFQDLVVDRYYTLQGGPYKDTGLGLPLSRNGS